ncbi:hypothetical protein AOCH_003293 [Aspergillus ochraceoroseus]|uniref:Disintegrin and metalloproteinase domain-containing protein B n=1 Tax=Aspergillus ochraceoroseus TaxID=138278 RepID=A0A0F8VDD1_9EURO|nr:hypothetical protein AOCH_003293 [Aspergillus ochraceoroseus]
MRFFRDSVTSIALLAGSFSLVTTGVNARSQAPNAIQRVSTIDQATIKTPSTRVHHLSHFDITFTILDNRQRVKLELEPNHDILAEDAYVQYLDEHGNIHQEEPIARHEHKVFKGRTLTGKGKGTWEPVGWARIYLKRDGPHPLFEGVFNIKGDNHHIELQSTYLQNKRPQDVEIHRQKDDYMVFYRDSDMMRPQTEHPDLKRSLSMSGSSTCEAEQLGFNSNPNHPVFQSFRQDESSRWASMPLTDSLFGLTKRQSDIGSVSGNAGGVNLASTIGSTNGCPTAKQVALIGIASDCSFYEMFNTKAEAQASIISTVNSASNECTNSASTGAQWNMPCSQGNITQRLDLFSQWRGSQTDDNAYWTLMSACPTGSEVGLSWLGQLCNNKVSSDGSNYVSGTNVVVRSAGSGWQVFAHESGHTFGAVHDCTAETCAQDLQASSQCCPLSTTTCNADGQYIMNPSTGTDITQFSACTVGNICSALGRNSVKSSCLSANKGIVTYSGAQCGNGIVEAGEDCDCGGEEGCGDNSCCDATTCKFKNGAVCDDANDTCCVACKYASAGTVCRASSGECDLQETCSGNSSSCPSDSFKQNGDSCGSSGSGLTCASGQCTSRDAQCQSLMGSLMHSNNTYACSGFSDSCELICYSSYFGECMTVNQNFLDGTPCDDGGFCSNGKCAGAKNWFDAHKNIVIGVACGVGGLLLISILLCASRRCRRTRYTMKPVPAGAYWAGPMAPPPPPPAISQMTRLPGQPPQMPYQTYPSPPAVYPGPAPTPGGPGGYTSPMRYA